MRDTLIGQFPIGPFKTRAKNLTPDNATGTGRFTERQIFNSLRYGLRPEETADVKAPYGTIIRILDAAKVTGLDDVGFVTS